MINFILMVEENIRCGI